MNALKLFENPKFGNVRTLETDEVKVMFWTAKIRIEKEKEKRNV